MSLRKKLEPGETVLWRYPPRLTRRQWVVRWAWAIAVGGAVFLLVLSYSQHHDILPGILAGVIAGNFIVNPLYDVKNGTLVLTDRRLLAVRLALWRISKQILIDEIVDVSTDTATNRHVVRGGGEEIEIAANRIDLDTLRQMLGREERLAS